MMKTGEHIILDLSTDLVSTTGYIYVECNPIKYDVTKCTKLARTT